MFIMVTNGEEDAVLTLPEPPNSNSARNTCVPAPIFCGIPNQLYPDARPMGYPFDRLPYSVPDQYGNGQGRSRMVRDLAEYVHGIPNIAAFQVWYLLK